MAVRLDCSVRMAPFSNVRFVFLLRRFEIGFYYVLTDFAFLFESDVLEIHSLIITGSPPWSILRIVLPVANLGTLSKISSELPLHCTLESFLSLHLFLFHLLTWDGAIDFLKNRDFITLCFSGFLAVPDELFSFPGSVVLSSSLSYYHWIV